METIETFVLMARIPFLDVNLDKKMIYVLNETYIIGKIIKNGVSERIS